MRINSWLSINNFPAQKGFNFGRGVTFTPHVNSRTWQQAVLFGPAGIIRTGIATLTTVMEKMHGKLGAATPLKLQPAMNQVPRDLKWSSNPCLDVQRLFNLICVLEDLVAFDNVKKNTDIRYEEDIADDAELAESPIPVTDDRFDYTDSSTWKPLLERNENGKRQHWEMQNHASHDSIEFAVELGGKDMTRAEFDALIANGDGGKGAACSPKRRKRRKRAQGSASIDSSITTPIASLETARSPSATATKSLPRRGGFRNLGNTCYMNAVLRSLLSIHSLRAHLAATTSTTTDAAASSSSSSTALQCVARVARALSPTRLEARAQPINLSRLQRCVGANNQRFKRNDQHDAHEFFLALLDELARLDRRRPCRARRPMETTSRTSVCALSRRAPPREELAANGTPRARCTPPRSTPPRATDTHAHINTTLYRCAREI